MPTMTRDSVTMIVPLVLLLACSGSDDAPTARCGDAVARGAEQCDGQDLSGQTCFLAGYLGGTLACRSDCTFDFGACQDPSPHLSTWNPACGNLVCELGEGSSGCPSDCGERTVTETPFAIHASSASQAEALAADLRAFVRLEALDDPTHAFQVGDGYARQTSTRIIVTTVSGAEVAANGFRYCLPTGSTLAAWLQFLGRAVERYDGDADVGCTFPGPDCYASGDGLFPDDATIASFQANPIEYWQVENEWFWQVDDCSGPEPTLPSPATMAAHLQAVATTIKSADGEATVIAGALSSVGLFAAMDWSSCHQFIEIGGPDDCAYREILMDDVTPEQSSQVSEARARVVETLRLSDPYFDVVDVHFYESRPHAMTYQAATVRRLLEEAGISRPIPLWSLENAGPYAFFPLMGLAQPTTCPPPPRTPAEMANGEYGGPYSDALLADFVAKHYAIATLAGFQKIAWSSSMPTLGWGEPFLRTALHDYDLNEKPAYHTYLMLSRELGDVRTVDKPLPEVYRFVMADGSVKLLAWSDAHVPQVDVSAILGTDAVSVRRLVREADVEPSPVTRDSHAVPVSPSPVLVERP